MEKMAQNKPRQAQRKKIDTSHVFFLPLEKDINRFCNKYCAAREKYK
jgi:hypothetical protein